MIATPGRSSRDPLPKLRQQRAEAPEFQVMFSRPADFTGRPDSRSNSFRWSGNGTIHVMERGLLIIAKRRSAMAFHTTQERFVPAAEICDVYREGNSVRVDLRGDLQQRDYFQFWTADAATAGTIVRLLPTTRTIEYEGGSGISTDTPKTPPPYRRRASVRTAILVALVAVGIASLITVDRLRHQPSERNEHTLTVPTTLSTGPTTGSAVPSTGPGMTQSTVPQHRATTAEVEAARADLKRFDERIDGLRAQYRMAFAALESGSLSQQDFIEGLDRWLLPQWRALDAELASNVPEDGSLGSVVRKHLTRSAVGWERALDDYIRGLNDQDAATVMEAFDRMSDANQAQRQAWGVINHAER